MITPTTILRDSALALPGVVALGGWIAGWPGAIGALVSGLVALGNLALLAWLVDRLVRAVAAGGGGGAVLLVFGKTLIAVGAFVALVAVFPPPSVALGLGAAILGLSVRGTLHALSIPDGAALEDT